MKFVVLGISIFFGTISMLAQSSGRVEGKTPKEVVEQFWSLETHGGTLTQGGWYRTSDFFIRPNSWPPNSVIHVISGRQSYNVDETARTENWAEVYVGISELGQVDPNLHFRAFPGHASNGALLISGPIRFDLVLSAKHWVLERNGVLGKAVTGPREWRIDCTANESFVTVATAIRYVANMRDKTTDPVIKKNADKTLAILKKLKE